MAGAVTAATLAGPPCRCPCSETSAAAGVVLARVKQGRRSCSRNQRKSCSKKQVHLYSTMTQAWQDSRLSARVLVHMVPCSTSGHHAPMVVDELGGQYEDTFDDVEKVRYLLPSLCVFMLDFSYVSWIMLTVQSQPLIP